MFDLHELDRAETALRALRGERPAPREAAQPAPRAEGNLSKCPFHNGTLQREMAA